jgi:hypothetical protein
MSSLSLPAAAWYFIFGSTVQVVQTWYTDGHGFSNSHFA